MSYRFGSKLEDYVIDYNNIRRKYKYQLDLLPFLRPRLIYFWYYIWSIVRSNIFSLSLNLSIFSKSSQTPRSLKLNSSRSVTIFDYLLHGLRSKCVHSKLSISMSIYLRISSFKWALLLFYPIFRISQIYNTIYVEWLIVWP